MGGRCHRWRCWARAVQSRSRWESVAGVVVLALPSTRPCWGYCGVARMKLVVLCCLLPVLLYCSCTCIIEIFYPHLSTMPTPVTCSWLLLLLPHNLTMQLPVMHHALFQSNQTVHHAIDTQKATTSVYLSHGIDAHCGLSRSVHGCVARTHSPRDLLDK